MEAEIETDDRPEKGLENQGLIDMNHEGEAKKPEKLTFEAVEAEIETHDRPVLASESQELIDMNHENDMEKPEDSKSTSLKPVIEAVEAEIETHDRPDQEVDSNGKKDEDGLFIETTTASDQPLGRVVETKVKLEKSSRIDTSLDDDVQVGLLS